MYKSSPAFTKLGRPVVVWILDGCLKLRGSWQLLPR